MKKMLVVAGLLLLLATAASAQTATRNFSINVGAGLSLPMGDFGDFANIGFHGAGVLYWPLAPKFEIGPAAEYHRFGTDFDESFGSFLLGGDIKFLLTEAAGTTEGGRQIMPFLTGGLGIAFSSFAGESNSDLYFGLGGGADIQKWFVKLRYVSIQTSGSSASFIPLTVGYRF